MGRRAALAAGAVGLLGLLVLALWPVEVITIRLSGREARLAAAVAAGPGAGLSLTFRHSVELSLVQGVFRVGPGPALYPVETRMEGVGTGLPNADPERTRREGRWLVVDEAGQRLDNGIRFFLSPVNRLRIEAAGREIDLSRIRPGGLLLIDVERVGRWRLVLWRIWGRQWSGKGGDE
jgi:hypothetical protein